MRGPGSSAPLQGRWEQGGRRPEERKDEMERLRKPLGDGMRGRHRGRGHPPGTFPERVGVASCKAQPPGETRSPQEAGTESRPRGGMFICASFYKSGEVQE